MKDPHDKATADLLQVKRGRGRPATGKAMTPAEKQRAYRERQKSGNAKGNGFFLSDAEATVIISLLQDKAREMTFQLERFGPVGEYAMHSRDWIAALAKKIADANRA